MYRFDVLITEAIGINNSGERKRQILQKNLPF